MYIIFNGIEIQILSSVFFAVVAHAACFDSIIIILYFVLFSVVKLYLKNFLEAPEKERKQSNVCVRCLE